LWADIQPVTKLNGEVSGKAVPNRFFYVDKIPGNYEVLASMEVAGGLLLTLDEGQTRYAPLNISMGFFLGHVCSELIENEAW
jgi:hypothetical protein